MPESFHVRAFRTALAQGGPERVAEVTFGVATFTAFHSALQPGDPRLPGAQDRLIELQAVAADLPAPPPRTGDSVSFLGRARDVSRADITDSGIATLLVTA